MVADEFDPAVAWEDDHVVLIDQTVLPHRFEHLAISSVTELIAAIKRLSVRGAPAIGVAGAYGVALAVAEHGTAGQDLDDALVALREARPTAVNLSRMVDRAAAQIERGFDRVLAEAHAVRDEEIAASVAMGTNGANLIADLTDRQDLRAMTVCNAGSLATVGRGTALAVVRTLHERSRISDVLVCETRPLLQGARLTAWELQRMGAPYHVIVDSSGPYLLARREVDFVVAGADRIATNGDTANKVGTYSLALAAQRAGVPFLVIAPESTVDHDLADGAGIDIEERSADEVTGFGGVATTPDGAAARNLAFDVTPADLITAIVTDHRSIRVDRGEVPGAVPV